MNYHEITSVSLKDGDGLRAVLWVAGCNHHCPGCQNPFTWDKNGGLLFDEDARIELFSYLDHDYCTGLTLSGGDPMFPDNRPDILNLLKRFRNRYGLSKTVWLYTGYTMSEIQFDPILEYVDVVVDGEYKEELRNVNRQWCGSENQVIWRKENGRFSAEPARYDTDTSGEWHEKEKGGCCSG